MLSIRTPTALRFGPALSTRQAGLGLSLERLSSGLRINRAADDAAGLGVATNLETASRSVRVAQRNVRDAMSVA
ncbi:MAG: flagellin FliC, partial [Myxococcota bacterium]|nr:flagellin FliC [Myxococcota bacterium]